MRVDLAGMPRITVDNILLVLAIALRLASSSTVSIAYLILAIYATKSSSNAIRAYVVSFLFTMLNPGIGGDAEGSDLARYVVICASSFSVYLHRTSKFRDRRVEFSKKLAMGMAAFVIIHSLVVSYLPSISIAKIVLWALVTWSIYTAFESIDANAREELLNEIYRASAVVLFLSIPLVAHPTGYLRNGTGFQGLLNHPQALGIFACVIAAWSIGKLTSTNSSLYWDSSLLVLAIGICLLSEARTSVLALLIGLSAAVVIRLLPYQRQSSNQKGRYRGKLIALGVCFIVALIAVKSPDALYKFLAKRTQNSSISDIYEASRGKLVYRMVANIEQQPVLGIGFGVDSIPGMMQTRVDPIFGFPISAPIEKGLLPLAILEELGVVGFGIFIVWIGLILTASRARAVAATTTAATILATNLAESTLFSVGGIGLYFLIVLVGYSTVSIEDGRGS